MTNYQAELPELFEIGVDLEAYGSMEELVDKCAYYLSHEEERKKNCTKRISKSEGKVQLSGKNTRNAASLIAVLKQNNFQSWQ